MKYYTVLVAAILVIAALGLYVYYENKDVQKTDSGTHIYLGAVYYGPLRYANSISANVDFGGDVNLKNNIYYVVLSIWDSNLSYDQIGISSLNGNFYSTYSYTEIVNGSIKYIFNPHWFPISPGEHQLSMYVSSGNVFFKFDKNTFAAFTGGNDFAISTNQKVGNHTFSGLTIYEEIYGFNNSFPGISFNFSSIQYSTSSSQSSTITDWTQFTHNLTNVSKKFSSYVYMKSNIVNIYNSQPLTLTLRVQNIPTSASLVVSDFNLTIPGNGQYSLDMMKGNYTLYLQYGGKINSYNISLNSNMTYQISG
ncbi:MAG: hypothetical protein ACP5NO_03600 [Thermoplasmata archaeon]